MLSLRLHAYLGVACGKLLCDLCFLQQADCDKSGTKKENCMAIGTGGLAAYMLRAQQCGDAGVFLRVTLMMNRYMQVRLLERLYAE